MSKKIIVIGGVAGGASVAARARRLDESAQITMYEKGPNVSFSNCALPYHLSGMIPDAESIVLMDSEQFKQQYNIDAIVNHEVTAIHAETQTVTVKDVRTGEVTTDSYDDLFLSPGAVPILRDPFTAFRTPMSSQFAMLTTLKPWLLRLKIAKQLMFPSSAAVLSALKRQKIWLKVVTMSI